MAAHSETDELNKRLFVAVHAGAGYHSEEKVAQYKKLCRKACVQAMSLLKKKKSAVEAVTSAVAVLEDSELSNAGRGSNLNITGSVECDASVMDGKISSFGAVGCISGILNPIKVACSVLESQKRSSLSLGRIPPSVLVSSGARDWAKQHGFICNNFQKLETENNVRIYKKYKRKIERAEKHHPAKKFCYPDSDSSLVMGHCQDAEQLSISSDCVQVSDNCQHTTRSSESVQNGVVPNRLCPDFTLEKRGVCQGIFSHVDNSTKCHTSATDAEMNPQSDEDNSIPSREDNPVQDTVGALCIDWEGNISSGVSSGGILLKHQGRLGPAAMYGVGCWAQNGDKEQPGVAVITSGSGEHLMRTLLAKTCADCMLSAENAVEGFQSCFTQHFLESRLLSDVDKKLAGIVAIEATQTDNSFADVEVFWGHTTDSMALGYMGGSSKTPTTLISKLSGEVQSGEAFTMSSDFYTQS